MVPNPPNKNFIVVSALIFSESYDIELITMRMNQNIEYRMFADQVFGNFIFSNSAFFAMCGISTEQKSQHWFKCKDRV